ncbi:uncharacterized protein LOC105190326 isoform X1 [Harpegnathos saltator]|uniref:Uncharacterized protein n=2 Tax=Harpegnathos saltator TaxID=610380 RepID=E2C5R6_HARSA|nr:uncharacterized protein LOC105190326 isoform X1 [Harpegnathos saltator]EFN76700.1 hypothetical protein EAI_05067 [Harpegnathos saltator]
MAGVLRRMFSSKRRLTNSLAGIRSKLKLLEDKSTDFDELDAHDIGEFEADFMNISESHKMYEREMVMNKERLKRQIVARKYFKESEPRFLTFEEKEQICTLHESDPEKWPVEKLSESFPALPVTIKKILRAKWSPKSVDSIVQYDTIALENWKKFRAGKLAVNPMLRQHLMKFKDRQIVMTDRELLAKKFVPPKPQFKKPTKNLFSSIVEGYLNEQQDNTQLQSDESNRISDVSSSSNGHQNLLAANTTTDDRSIAARNSKQLILNSKKDLTLKLQSDLEKDGIVSYNDAKKNNKIKKKLFTFNEFVKAGLNDTFNMSPEESATLLDVYKEQVNTSGEEQAIEVATASRNEVINSEKNSAISKYEDCDSDVEVHHNQTDTYIKAWIKKIDTEGNYLNPIKIAKNVYKPGMTYRINDCYYDDDGEFLYRVPGVRS